MNSFQILLIIAPFFGCANAAILLQNNFDNVDSGGYSGATGVSFKVGGIDTDTTLGNLSSTSASYQTSVAVGGVNDSRSLFGTSDMAVRSRSTASTAITTSFSIYFNYSYDTVTAKSYSQGVVGAGWATAAGTDNIGTYGTEAGSQRFLIGLKHAADSAAGAEKLEFASMGNFSSAAAIGTAGSFSVTENNWYQLSFELTYNGTDTNWDVTNLNLRDWGIDGVTGGTSIGSIAAVNDISGGSAINGAGSAFAYTMSNRDRGVHELDNLVITNIPEPSISFLSFISLLPLFRRKRI